MDPFQGISKGVPNPCDDKYHRVEDNNGSLTRVASQKRMLRVKHLQHHIIIFTVPLRMEM